jgi:Aspartyl protease
MPILRGRFADGKPLVRVGLAPVLPRPGEVRPMAEPSSFQMTPLRALLDTGADGTSITRSVAKAHNLQYAGLRPAIGIGGQETLPTWLTFLSFFFDQDADFEGDNHVTTGVFIFPRPLLALEIRDFAEFDAIIGRDVLAEYDFSSVKGEWRLVLS